MASPIATITVAFPGLSTFGQVLSPGAALYGVHLDNCPTQVDAKAFWPDGSIRFAVVTVDAVDEGTYYLWPGSSPDSSAPAPPFPDDYWLWLTMNPDTDDATDWYAQPYGLGKDLWLDGPLVREGRCVSTLWREDPDQPGEWIEHPFLRVVFDVRVYADGQTRLDVTLENCLDHPLAQAARYHVRAYRGEDQLWSQENVVHPYLCRWRKVYGINPFAGADFEPAYQAGALPRYLPTVVPRVDVPAGEYFEPFRGGSLSTDMGAHGGREELAPYPGWTARYLVHGDSTQGRWVLAHGDLAGSWPVHVRNPDGTLVTLDERPDYWLDGRPGSHPRPTGNLSQTGQLRPDNAHQPSLAYVPYLMTGDRYYADEMAFWANYVLLSTWPAAGHWNGRQGAAGILAGNQIRGFGWGLRNMTDAAAYLPDADPMKGYLQEKVQNNLAWLDNFAAGAGPIGAAFMDFDTSISPNHAVISLWAHNYLAWAVDHANQQGIQGGTAWRDQIAQFQLRLFNDPTYDRNAAAPYRIAVGTRDPGSGAMQFFTEVGQCIPLGPTQFQGFYGIDARMMLLVGMREGWAGAAETYSWLHQIIGVELFTDGLSDLSRRAGWALAP